MGDPNYASDAESAGGGSSRLMRWIKAHSWNRLIARYLRSLTASREVLLVPAMLF